MVQRTPVPAQTMHSSTSRRPNPFFRSSGPSLAISYSPYGAGLQMAQDCAAQGRLGTFGLYSRAGNNSGSVTYRPRRNRPSLPWRRPIGASAQRPELIGRQQERGLLAGRHRAAGGYWAIAVIMD